MDAVELIDRLDAEGRMIVTSNVQREEEGSDTKPEIRDVLADHINDFPRVAKDHRVRGFSTLESGPGASIINPIITNVVDVDLFARLQNVGLKADDARHLMNAFVNDCAYFVTLDRGILRRKAAEAICAPMRIVKPTELVAALQK
jgi:hypothetical protein